MLEDDINTSGHAIAENTPKLIDILKITNLIIETKPTSQNRFHQRTLYCVANSHRHKILHGLSPIFQIFALNMILYLSLIEIIDYKSQPHSAAYIALCATNDATPFERLVRHSRELFNLIIF